MAAFETHIPLSFGTGLGIGSITTTSTSYVETANPAYVSFDPASFNGSTIYFEADMKVSGGTAYAMLYDTAGNAVAGSEVTVTSASATIARSVAITVAAGDYTVRIKVDNGANTNTYYSSRIIVVQNASAITKTETHIPLVSNGGAFTDASYADLSTIYWGFFRYTSANWDGTVAIYLEATLKTTAGTGTVALHDSSNNLVTSSECATTSASFVKIRSSAISLTNATDYKVREKVSGGGTVTITDARIVIVQTASPTKAEKYITLLKSTTAMSATGGTFQDSLHKITYTSTNWSADTISWVHDASAFANVAGTLETYNITGATRTTGSNSTTTANNVMTRYRSGTVTMPTSQDITARADSGVGTIYQSMSHLVAILVWTNTTATTSSNLIVGEI